MGSTEEQDKRLLDTGDLKLIKSLRDIPTWVKAAVLAATLLIGYGELRVRVEHAERANISTEDRCKERAREFDRRLDKVERIVEEVSQNNREDLLLIRQNLGNVQLEVARMSAKIRERR